MLFSFHSPAQKATVARSDLQVAIPDHLELNYIKSIMMSYGAYGAQMTGSGSAVYGLFDSFEYAAVACTMLKDNYPQVFIAKTV